MNLDIKSTVKLNNGLEMPLFGLGVFKIEGGFNVNRAVVTALEEGYRLIDTASLYRNENGVGEAICMTKGVAREKVFVTSKVWNDDQGYDRTRKAFDKSMNQLGFSCLDLYLVHWPVKNKFKETWRAMEAIYQEGRVRAIGVSNFMQHHLEDLMAHSAIVPAVNQFEHHPRLIQQPLLDFCKDHEIQVQAWAPIMKGEVSNIPVLQEIGSKYGKTPAQVVLRWNLQKGVATIPKSERPSRIRENADIFDFKLTGEDMAKIDALDKNERIGPDPDSF